MQRNELIEFFQNIEDREKYIGELRAEIKEAYLTFAEAQGAAVPALKSGYKFYRAANKDKQEADVTEFMRGKIIEALCGNEF